MKIIVRAFVVVLALTGAVASTQTSAASARTIASSSAQVNYGAVPTCPPDGTTDCGLAANSKGK
jgi:hypothetical protein